MGLVWRGGPLRSKAGGELPEFSTVCFHPWLQAKSHDCPAHRSTADLPGLILATCLPAAWSLPFLAFYCLFAYKNSESISGDNEMLTWYPHTLYTRTIPSVSWIIMLDFSFSLCTMVTHSVHGSFAQSSYILIVLPEIDPGYSSSSQTQNNVVTYYVLQFACKIWNF